MDAFRKSDDEIDLQKYSLALRRQWLPSLGVLGTTVGLAAFTTIQQEPIYEAKGELLLQKTDQTSELIGLSDKIAQFDSVAPQANPLETEATIIRSVPLVQEVIDSLKLTNGQGKPLSREEFLSNLQVQGLRGTDVLEISYRGIDPKQASAIANRLMELYISNDIQNHRSQTIAAREFISHQLPITEAAVQRAEAELRRFKEANQIIALDQEAQSTVQFIADLERQITETQAQLIQSTARSRSLMQQVGRDTTQSVAISTLSQSPAVQKAFTDLNQVEGELAVQRTLYQDTHPTIETLERKRTALKSLLQDLVTETVGAGYSIHASDLQMGEVQRSLVTDLVKAEIERTGLASRMAVLKSTYESQQGRASVLPQLEENQRLLERRLEVARATYEILLKKFQEVQLVENQTVGNAQVLSPSMVPDRPISPSLRKNVALGGTMGLLLALATVLLLEMIDTSIRNTNEAKQLFNYTFLGSLPNFGSKKRLVFGKGKGKGAEPEKDTKIPVRDKPNSSISEAYQILQTRLRFLSSDHPTKVIVVTSSVPEEGKSTVSANLALSLTQLGRRVLLIDADMRRPSQQEAWNLPSSRGLSNVLVGEATMASAIHEINPNLSILCAGIKPPNPVAILDSQRMSSLLNDLSSQYDYVIVDTPPLVIVADALILGKMADGVLLVARPGVVGTVSATTAKNLLDQSGVNVLGLVVNDAPSEDNSHNYTRYHYYYTHPSVAHS